MPFHQPRRPVSHRGVLPLILLALLFAAGLAPAGLPTAAASALGLTLAAGGWHTCAGLTSGGVKCWGQNGSSGQLGDGTTTDRLEPVAVQGITSKVTALAAGYRHTCALLPSGGVKCWGSNYYGQLGDGTKTTRLTPVKVQGLDGVTALAAGGHHTCAVLTSGGVKCWGWNIYGQLGDGTKTTRTLPVAVQGIASGVTVGVGYGHSCAELTSGVVKCWGSNGYGQLGNGTTTDRLTPAKVPGLNGVTALEAGYRHTCAGLTSGGVKCWGWNAWGQLGDGTKTTRLTPVKVQGIASKVAALAAGDGHTCVPLPSGGVKCWGYNYYGQLGDGTTTQRLTPVKVLRISSGVTALAAGGNHTCAVLTTGRVQCWGWNAWGQLGDGTTTHRLTPVRVGLAGDVTALAAGTFHTCALLTSGGVKCWGRNNLGQLGDGTTTNRSTPVGVAL